GLFHPHSEYHHIKKENIGLIEVMGLAVLPARLKEELSIIENILLSSKDISSDFNIDSHKPWIENIRLKYSEINKEN
ncbi:UDP-glucose--hexose-1-phosphate uridylyltransferase, partial [Streptococcus pyogenes]